MTVQEWAESQLPKEDYPVPGTGWALRRVQAYRWALIHKDTGFPTGIEFECPLAALEPVQDFDESLTPAEWATLERACRGRFAVTGRDAVLHSKILRLKRAAKRTG